MVSIVCPDGVTHARPRTGGDMAHQVVCKTFGCTLQRPVAGLHGGARSVGPTRQQAANERPSDGKWADLSIIGYVERPDQAAGTAVGIS